MAKSRLLGNHVVWLGLLLALILTLVPGVTGLVPEAAASATTGAAGAATLESAQGFAAGSAGGDTTIYVVRRGDTLASIARRFNTTVSALVRLNNIRNPDRIYVGQRLRVPAPGGGTGNPTRIRFPAGGTSATVTGSVTFPNRACYVLAAQTGQEMSVQVMSSRTAANFLLTSLADGMPLKRLENESRSWTGTLPANGDYLICVATATGTVPYSLSVWITPLDTSPEPVRIRFPTGGTSATRTGNVSGVGSQCYILRALAGQLMTVQVSSPGDVASFTLVGADGQPLKRAEVGGPYFSNWLVATQDYTICVRIPAGTGATGYTMFVSVTN